MHNEGCGGEQDPPKEHQLSLDEFTHHLQIQRNQERENLAEKERFERGEFLYNISQKIRIPVKTRYETALLGLEGCAGWIYENSKRMDRDSNEYRSEMIRFHDFYLKFKYALEDRLKNNDDNFHEEDIANFLRHYKEIIIKEIENKLAEKDKEYDRLDEVADHSSTIKAQQIARTIKQLSKKRQVLCFMISTIARIERLEEFYPNAS